MIATSGRPSLSVPFEHAAGDDHVERGLLELLVRGERDPGALDQCHPGGADRTGERQAGEHGAGARGVDGDDVVQVTRVQRQDRADDLDLVAQALDERRAQRPVDQPAGEDGVFTRDDPHGGRTSRGSCRSNTSAPRRQPSRGRSRADPWAACWRKSPTRSWSRRRDRPRQRRRPGGLRRPVSKRMVRVPPGLLMTASVTVTSSLDPSTGLPPRWPGQRGGGRCSVEVFGGRLRTWMVRRTRRPPPRTDANARPGGCALRQRDGRRSAIPR